ncbi:glycosyltransferase family 4 protein [Aeromonas sp. 82P]|nr:glycosyltransferase family 1 protein [Aeromonas veronii]
MVQIDDIIYRLQSKGGISVYFDQLISGLEKSTLDYKIVGHEMKNRFLDRYRYCQIGYEEEYGVFHSSYYRLPDKRKKLKVVTTVHDFTYEKFLTGPAKWVHSWQKNKAIRNSDLVICVSYNTAKDLQQYCPVDPSKIRVIYNGVSDSYHPIDALSNEESQQAVVFVGARSGYKNFTLAVESVAVVPSLQLQIIGGGKLSEDEIKHLERYLPNRYCWLGRLSDEELNQTYNQAYALLYPSSYEGFGIPVIEAMRAGCPVIAVNVSSIPEVAGDAAILVNEPTVVAFSDALIKLPVMRKQLITAGLEQAAKFSWGRCFEETLAVYKELLAK